MDDGPLPPHERPWRHPSELGPPAHEPTTTAGRVLIVSTATLGLLLVGVLALSMTPRRSGSPQAASSTVSAFRGAPTTPAAIAELPLVTPVGDGWGVTTADAIEVGDPAGDDPVRVRLPSGEEVSVTVVGTDVAGDVTIVSLPADTEADAFELATVRPGPTDTVLISNDDQLVVTMDELASLDVAEATPVLDEQGRLVGLCTGPADHHWVAPVDTVPGVPSTTTTTARPTTTAEPGPTTVRPSTTTPSVTSPPPATTRPPRTTTPSTTIEPAPAPSTSIVASTTTGPGVSSDRDGHGGG